MSALVFLPNDILELVVVTGLHPCGYSLQRLRSTCKCMRRWLQRLVGLRREVYFADCAMQRLGDAVLTPLSLQRDTRRWEQYVGKTVHDAYYGNRRVRTLQSMVSRQAGLPARAEAGEGLRCCRRSVHDDPLRSLR